MVTCIYPEDQFEEGGSPPEGFDEWRTSETCSHEYCIEAADILRDYRATRAPYTAEEIEAMNADRDLVLDETGGRGFE